MLLINCPYCDEARDEAEFSCTGEAHISRPPNPEALSDQDWGDYLYFRSNPRGLHHEMWYHAAGCRRYFNITRDTVSYAILESYRIDAEPSITPADDATEVGK